MRTVRNSVRRCEILPLDRSLPGENAIAQRVTPSGAGREGEPSAQAESAWRAGLAIAAEWDSAGASSSLR